MQRGGSSDEVGPTSSPVPRPWKVGTALRRVQSVYMLRHESSKAGIAARSPGLAAHARAASMTELAAAAAATGGGGPSRSSSGGGSPSPLAAAAAVSAHNDDNHRQLREYVRLLRAAQWPGAEPDEVDDAYGEYCRVREQGAALVGALLTPQGRQEEERRRWRPPAGPPPPPGSGGSSPDVWTRGSLTPSDEAGWSDAAERPDAAREAGDAERPKAAWLGAVQDWRACIGSLLEAHRASLLATFRAVMKDHDPRSAEGLLTDEAFRARMVARMRITSGFRPPPTIAYFWPRYEARLRAHDRLRADAAEVAGLLQAAESGIAPGRAIEEHVIAARGDAVLEFANAAAPRAPALRFRVSSSTLAQTSPLFARMFGAARDGDDDSPPGGLRGAADDLATDLPPLPPAPFTCRDGSEARLYRMPQLELDREGGLSVLLHAAHMHNARLPRDIAFEQFVAVAEACLRYRCTSPVEVIVENRWLPQWVHRASDPVPEGLLTVSYAFGLRRLFARTSKSAILNLAGEADLRARPWPQRVKDRLWAVRQAKVAQARAACAAAVRDYLPPPGEAAAPAPEADDGLAPGAAPALSGAPRCPRGSRWCDAANLGWLLLAYNEARLLDMVMEPAATAHLPAPPERSLAQLLDAPRLIPRPPHPAHPEEAGARGGGGGGGGGGGACDPVPAFCAAVNAVYNSIGGLSLFEVSGREHGWALSAGRDAGGLGGGVRRDGWAGEQEGRGPGVPGPGRAGGALLSEELCLLILQTADNIADLHAAAMISRRFYATYKKHELPLMRNVVRAGRRRTPGGGGERGVGAAGAKTPRPDGPGEAREAGDEGAAAGEPGAETLVDGFTMLSLDGHETLPSEAGAGVMMTEEEARRILWPDPPTPRTATPEPGPAPAGAEGGREKFRAQDVGVAGEKTLVVVDGKRLREDHDGRVGLAPNRRGNK